MNSILSDYNKPNYHATVVAGPIYRDLSFSFIHPGTGDILPATDVEAIKNSVKNIVLTPLGSRPFLPEFGTRVASALFELADEQTAAFIKDEISNGIRKWESRVSNLNVQVSDDADRNSYRVTIVFTTTYNAQVEFVFLLNRTR